ncbi:MAG TPA: hypothetical protein VMF06_11540 [Candidatus Limnocylindria bacterium]|nr:hypothetical protein [Candidatus Limnocylindria bacterium]
MRQFAWIFLRLAACLSLLLGVAGCQSYGDADWKSLVGHYSFDEAVKELGPPGNKETLTDGTVVAEWLTSKGRVHGSTSYGMWRSGWINLDSGPDYYLQLQFGPDHQLSSYKRVLK